MKRALTGLAVVVITLAMSGCSMTLPRNSVSLQRQKFPALVVYTNLSIYRFMTYDIRDSSIRGLSQTYKKGTETLSHGPLEDNYPPIMRTLGLKDILRIDAEDSYNEPAFDLWVYLILPAAIAVSILGPIIVRESP